MFQAYDKANHSLVSLMFLNKEEINKLKQKHYLCLACKQPVIIKNGSVKLAHFAHQSKKFCEFFSERETKEHLLLKEIMVRWCKKEGLIYQLECYLPTIKQRPDLLIGNIAVEIQCSPLSIERLKERTKAYQENGYIPWWICGEKLLPKGKLPILIKHFCSFSRNFGFYFWGIDWKEKNLILYFHIEESYTKKLYYEKKTWPLYSFSLLTIFFYPILSTFSHQRVHNTADLIKDYIQNLTKKLMTNDKCIYKLQQELYSNHLHLLELPYWFYYPGISLFCCKESEILIKYLVWKIIDKHVDQKITHHQLLKLISQQLRKHSSVFYAFPCISLKVCIGYCSYQLYRWLIDSQILLPTTNDESWMVRQAEKRNLKVDQSISKKMKSYISATPYQV
ncbi:competence protein CoiA [Melissococcus plutonius]|uniref:Competence protein CoiA n=3 Tax=Melissococcus plutonius TaxID=33970 RepID=F3Y9M1_MELPT|nr:competence protein CoiA family protein [Melissococcus plutonius]BAL62417.1 hypothetical protein MPD5_1199 [Melissococcus plutonius DAT561]AIM25663.1 hypothetical protein MEPL_c006450 [Melissococcus plutonius S1]KMT24853.1 hypothetical protein MEPL2_2c03920 [Melissococcus plutonius]KMT26490.1 hypothetical protein MEPL3_2c01550 [Melissococcus plutonius]KMT27740.1 hypothetical protein MEPL1_3c03850 [Melissococcus plutonius]